MPSKKKPDPKPLGWDAIDSAFARLYGDQEPKHWAPTLPAMFGGDDPLQGVSAYACDEPRHWHFVTYGFSELYEKEWEDPELSGSGYELTFRLARGDESEPEPWCVNFLQNLARYEFNTANKFDVGHYFDLHGPIKLGSPTNIKAISFMEDPQLSVIETPNGRVRFLQVAGITLDELQALKRWHSVKFLHLLTATIPLALTDLDRDSILFRPAIRKTIDDGCLKDGSSTAHLHVSALSWEQKKQRGSKTPLTIVTLGANGARDLGPILKGRIPYGEDLTIHGSSAAVWFEPGEETTFKLMELMGSTYIRVSLTASDAQQLADLIQPKTGTYTLPTLPQLQLIIEPSEITDREGNVVEVIG